MLNFVLIEKSTKYAIDCINKSQLVHPGLYFVAHLLHADLLEKLQTYIHTKDLEWKIQESQIGTEYPGRKKINWAPDTVIEETHIVLSNLTYYLNQLLDRSNKFLGLSIWRDDCTYHLSPHTDNPVINISMQIYLNNDNMDLGTKFNINDTIVKAPYIVNHGYLMDNVQHIFHYYDGKPPADYYRYSLHAVWADANK